MDGQQALDPVPRAFEDIVQDQVHRAFETKKFGQKGYRPEQRWRERLWLQIERRRMGISPPSPPLAAAYRCSLTRGSP